MPRFKQILEIQQLMSRKELIRNIGIIAHIDHGKTTLADSLLAGTGLLSPRMAGVARVLDYLEEEQKRKITIKTANISLLYKTADTQYVINLVDTPGHVDFTGKVTRALRVIDGAVVVVDAVEEIMAQTEIVTKQALEERVRPVLFINKIDRLITELHLNEEQIQKKLDQIISHFNDLIELYAEPPFKDQWKIDASLGNVAFGSALHGWGFTMNMARHQEIKFSEIVTAYIDGTQAKLQRILPVYKAIFDMAINLVPNPQEAQSYRIEKIWDGHVESKIGKALVECIDHGPTAIFVTNIHEVSSGVTVATGRIFSGKIKKGDKTAHIELASTPDILATIRTLKESKIFVGFAAETENLKSYAQDKMVRKGLDMIVANRVGEINTGFASDTNSDVILSPEGVIYDFEHMGKEVLAHKILDLVKERL